MFTNPLDQILCLDIETAPQYGDYKSVPEELQLLWNRKAEMLKKKDNENAETIYPRAGIYAEFGKIICISTGFISYRDGHRQFRIKTFKDKDENILLAGFLDMLMRMNRNILLCAHNGKEFDFPYIARRTVIHGLQIPPQLNFAGRKPWEVPHIDTLDLWKFGDYKHYTPLNLLAYILGIQSPKDDIDGTMVGDVYWKENNLERIVTYCQKDVVTVMQILLRFRGENLLSDNEIEYC
jgi:uncharacterized protein YprB with RNaseH-like and TPR domain